MEVARAHLLVPNRSVPDGPHRGVPIPQFPRPRREKFSHLTRSLARSARDQRPQAEDQRRIAGAIHHIRRALRIPQHTSFLHPARDDCRTVAARSEAAQEFLTEDERNRIGLKSSPVADRRRNRNVPDRRQQRLGGSHSLMDAHFDAHRMPVQAVNYLDARDLQGSILTPDYWGGYIIYRLYPKVHVVVDDRHDLYGAEFLKSYLRMMHVERGWDEYLRDHTARSLLLPRNSPLATILANNPEWRSVYADDMAIVFMNSSEKFSSTRAGNVETPASAKGITKGN